jgi:hypothetical protein
MEAESLTVPASPFVGRLLTEIANVRGGLPVAAAEMGVAPQVVDMIAKGDQVSSADLNAVYAWLVKRVPLRPEEVEDYQRREAAAREGAHWITPSPPPSSHLPHTQTTQTSSGGGDGRTIRVAALAIVVVVLIIAVTVIITIVIVRPGNSDSAGAKAGDSPSPTATSTKSVVYITITASATDSPTQKSSATSTPSSSPSPIPQSIFLSDQSLIDQDMNSGTGEANEGTYTADGVQYGHAIEMNAGCQNGDGGDMWADWNLGRSWHHLNGAIALSDDDATGSHVTYTIYLDGRTALTGSVGLGQSAPVRLNVTGVFRVRLSMNDPSSPNNVCGLAPNPPPSLVWGNLTATS